MSHHHNIHDFNSNCFMQNSIRTYGPLVREPTSLPLQYPPVSRGRDRHSQGGRGGGRGSDRHSQDARESKPIIYSICIPRVFKNISERRIRAVIYSLNFGFVERVDMVPKKNPGGKDFWRVFVHFSKWNNSEDAYSVKAKLDNDEQVKIVYDNPWYWMISKSRVPRPEERDVQKKECGSRPKPFIDFSYKKQADEYEEGEVRDEDDDSSGIVHPTSPVMDIQSPVYHPESPSYQPQSPGYNPDAEPDAKEGKPSRVMSSVYGDPL